MRSRICWKAACCAGFSSCRARIAAFTATVSGLSETIPLRASERAAALACFTASSSSFRLCEPGCSSRKARSSRSGLLSLGSGPLPARASSTRSRSDGRAQRIALRLHFFGDDEALALQRADRLVGQRHRFGQIGRRERTLLEHAQNLQHRIVRRGIEQELARGIAPGIGQRPDFAAADFRGRAAACRAALRPAARSSSRRSTGPAPAVRRSAPARYRSGAAHRAWRPPGGSSWQRRMTPVSLRVPNGTIRRQPARTRCRSVSGSE